MERRSHCAASMRQSFLLVISVCAAVPMLLIGACAQSDFILTGPEDGDGEENPFADDDDDDGTQTGDDDGNPSTSSGSTPAGCDDPSTCQYDLETTCAGQPRANPSSFEACPTDICGGGGHCVPSAAVPADQLDLLAHCDSTTVCVPDTFIERGGLVIPSTCTSDIGGGEGRCLSSCLPDVSRKADLLSSSGCGSGELCVPCYDPFSGAATGACELSCDAGPTQAAKTLPKCCQDQGGGTCVPTNLVDGEQADRLDDEECPELGAANSVCVPNPILQAHLVGVQFNPVECVTGDLIQSLGLGSEGGCLPECIPIVDAIPVTQENCPNGYKCVPCDVGGQETGACEPQ